MVDTNVAQRNYTFNSKLEVSERALRVLTTGRILTKGESPKDMVNRIVQALAREEEKFSNYLIACEFAQKLGRQLDDGRIVMSTPIMTNALHADTDKPLSACTMPAVDLHADPKTVRSKVSLLHQQGMGTGFNLDDQDDPVSMLRFLNNIAISGASSGQEDRPVGNMAVLSVYHPRVKEFIEAKIDASKNGEEWKFNLSVDVDEDFFKALENGSNITDMNGKSIDTDQIFGLICSAARSCADPGLIFLDRMNQRNPVPGIGNYKTTAPCAEVGLMAGETCQFGYINLGKFVSRSGHGDTEVDFIALRKTTAILTRALDNALEISIEKYTDSQSIDVMQAKRKIGVGICGLADAISIAGLNYDSDEARKLAIDMLAYINYWSKQTSIILAQERGSAKALHVESGLNHRFFEECSIIEDLYVNQPSTKMISQEDWRKLSKMIRQTKLLRNTTTVALPPTGRSALVYDASTGVEPHFTISRAHPEIRSKVAETISSRTGTQIQEDELDQVTGVDQDYIAEACNVAPLGHLKMAATLQTFTDESISKTVNMPQSTSTGEIAEIYKLAHSIGMSGITVYVENSHTKQPIELTSKLKVSPL